MEYNDIITFEEKAFLLLEDDAAWELIEDSRYQPIIQALRVGPMTVKELEIAYNQIVAEKIDEMPLDSKEKKALKEKTKRKGKTLYKYLDKLEKKGIVVQAGKRVKMGQTASETLYGRSAKLFIKDDKHKIALVTAEIKKTLPLLSKIISLERDEKKLSDACLAEFLNKLIAILSTERDRILNQYSDEITQLATDLYYNELQTVLQGLDFYLLIQHAPELMKELEKCFK
jgi:hypothetical protein